MEASDITSRAEKVSSIVLAEIYRFHRDRVVDFREMMKFMLHEQIKFYTEVGNFHIHKLGICICTGNILDYLYSIILYSMETEIST